MKAEYLKDQTLARKKLLESNKRKLGEII